MRTCATSEPCPVSVIAKHAEQLAGDDVGEVGVVVARGAEVQHRAAEQAPLHARLDEQRQVAEGEHLEAR